METSGNDQYSYGGQGDTLIDYLKKVRKIPQNSAEQERELLEKLFAGARAQEALEERHHSPD
ncbi:MAG: hypothetical protein LBC43_04925 [Bifidobacteriaceae bacterium]|nr:hypothetical protein [Bifidobacteriaceae bacterium]